MTDTSSNKIFVTGGTGLVGSHLLLSLSKKRSPIIALKRSSSDLSGVKNLFERHGRLSDFHQIEWREGEVNDVVSIEQAMQGCNEVYHTAACVSFAPSDKSKLFKINIEGTANVVNVALTLDVDKFCFVSSTAAIGKEKNGKQITENTKWESDFGNSNYGISKHYAEREVWRAMEEGLNVVVVNPSVILGPGNWDQSSSNLFLKVWSGLRHYTEGSNAFVDVRDVVRSMIELMNHEIYGEKFLIVSENMTFRNLFDQIAEALGKKKPSSKATSLMIKIAWRLEKVRSFLLGRTPLITRETVKSATSSYTYSNKKITERLSFDFIPINTSIKDTAEVFLKEHQ